MLEILYHDTSLIAIDKPPGLLVHRSRIDRRETRFAMQMLRDQVGRHVYPIHRLDKPTSGVLLFALSAEVARRMGGIFASRETLKEYLAVVRGYPEEQAVIDYPLREELDRMTDRKARLDKPPQPAVTEYQCLARVELPYPVGRYQSARYALLKVTPRTGRKHQIRRHMKHIFHPVVGDTSHGDGRHNQLFRERFNCHRLLLAATRLRFQHPLRNEVVSIHAPLDRQFNRVMAELRRFPGDGPPCRPDMP